MKVAETILAQLGGNKFKAMTGAQSFTGGPASLTFKIPRSRNIRAVVITLNGSDLYDLEFFGIRSHNVFTVSKSTDIYAENLGEVFTAATGLSVSL